MKKERYHSNDLKRLILKNKISAMVEIKEAMGTNMDATIFRKLRAPIWNYTIWPTKM